MIGKIIKGKYLVEYNISKNESSEVYLCRNIELGNTWAIKFLPSNQGNVRQRAEVEILKRLEHFSLPKIIDVFEDESGLFLIESYIEGQTLSEKLKMEGPFAEENLLEWAIQLCQVLVYLHSIKPNPIIYRDMKPQNVIITSDNRAVLIDFGISKEFCPGKKEDFFAYTPKFAAPEQINAKGISDERTDIYNFGAMLFNLLTGSVHYTFLNRFLGNKKISYAFKRLILKCIQLDPAQRYQTSEELRKDLLSIKNAQKYNLKNKFINKLLKVSSLIMTIFAISFIYLGIAQAFREKSTWIEFKSDSVYLSDYHVGTSAKALNKEVKISFYPGDNVFEVNSTKIKGEKSFVQNGTTLVPIGIISEAFGLDMEWNDGEKSLSILGNEKLIKLFIGKKEAFINQVKIPLLLEPMIINGRTMVPIRFVSENLNLNVAFNDATKQIQIMNHINLGP